MLTLRAMRPDDEPAVEAAHAEMAAEGFDFLLHRDRAGSFDDYLRLLDRQRRGLDSHPGRVRASFLVAEAGGTVVGRVSIRHELNERLEREGGHIGYGVLREHRRRGHGTEMLRQSLEILAAEGVPRALVTCDEGNLGSAITIERCRGELVDRIVVGGKVVHHYLIPTGA